jgi:hypothetical protein
VLKVSNRLAALEKLESEAEINTIWEMIRENMLRFEVSWR